MRHGHESNDDLFTALANIALGSGGWPCSTHKDAVGPRDEIEALLKPITDVSNGETREALFMLLTLVADMWRKLQYIFIASREFASHSTELESARVLTHNSILEDLEHNPKAGWDERAEWALAIVHQLLKDTEKQQRALLMAASHAALDGFYCEEYCRIKTIVDGKKSDPKTDCHGEPWETAARGMAAMKGNAIGHAAGHDPEQAESQ